MVTPFYFSKIGKRKEGLQAVAKDGKIGFLDNLGRIAIPFKFDEDYSLGIPFIFQDGISIVYLNGKYGFIDKDGNTVAPFKYEAVSYFKNKIAIVFKDGIWEQINF
ncbi:MAG: WG repeat-containing protein [Saprospiraceae bacterium]